jgi:hypothetical protein
MRLRRINVSSPAQAVRGGNEEEADGEIEIEIEEDEEEEANATEEAAAGGHNTRRNRNTATVNGGGTAPPVPLQHSSSDVQRPTFGPPSWTTLLRVQYHKLRSYLYPLLVFLFILTNVFFVTVSKHLGPGVENEGSVASAVAAGSQGAFDPDGSVYNNWISLISDFCINTAPLLSWLGAFWMVGWSDERSTLIFFEQLSNLELYSRKTVRNYLVGAALAGIVLMATSNLTDVSGSGASTKQSFFQLVNTGLFVLLNYLITTFVICALASLICIFHYYSLSIFLEQLYSQDITVVEALREHTVLMRLQHESAKHVQYILFPPFILYVTGALLAAYNMLSLRVYTELSTTIFQLILAFVTLMVRQSNTRARRVGHASTPVHWRLHDLWAHFRRLSCLLLLLLLSPALYVCPSDSSCVRCPNHARVRRIGSSGNELGFDHQSRGAQRVDPTVGAVAGERFLHLWHVGQLWIAGKGGVRTHCGHHRARQRRVDQHEHVSGQEGGKIGGC